MNELGNIFKGILIIMVLFFVFGFFFRILFKLGILALIILGVLYLYKKVFGKKI